MHFSSAGVTRCTSGCMYGCFFPLSFLLQVCRACCKLLARALDCSPATHVLPLGASDAVSRRPRVPRDAS
jgi:hypothetical protein